MLYVIPFIILLIVAVILKKNAANKEEKAPANKANAKKRGKKAAGKTAARPRTESREVTPTVLTEQKKTTPVPQELHQTIVNLIQAGHYSTAEAQINQALNRDNSQHALYLHLLDIHILQKDEFAIEQLINHLRALDLQDIVMQAEAKQREYEQQKQPDALDYTVDSLDFKSNHIEKEVAAPQKIVSDADFDALVQPSAYVDESPVVTEDPPQLKPESSLEVKPLEFNFSFDQQPKAEELHDNITAPTPEASAQLTEFSLTLEPREVSSHHIENTQSIELDTSPSTPVETDASKPALDFSNLDFAPQPTAVDTEKADVLAEIAEPALPEFKLDQVELDPVAPQQEITSEPVLAFEQDNQVIAETTSTTSALNINDPLVQSFPELAQLNEAQLDLDLAGQYIELGAYESARILLTKNETLFSAEQRELSKNLLNRIAS